MGRIAGYFNTGNKGIDSSAIFREMEIRRHYDALIYTKDEVLVFPSGSEIPDISSNGSMITFFDPAMTSSTTSSMIDLSSPVKDVITICDVDLYNREDLSENYEKAVTDAISNDADLLALFIHNLLKKAYNDKLNELDILSFLDTSLRQLRGVYAFACKVDGKVYLGRDLIGVKPLWYDLSSGLAFASEKKFLENAGYMDIKELSPRQLLCYDLEENTIMLHGREFLSEPVEVGGSEDDVRDELLKLLMDAVSVRVPDEDFGVMFSAGIDSTILASICKDVAEAKGVSVTCYSVGLSGDTSSPDIICAKKIAGELGLNLKVHEIDLDKVEEYLKVVVPLIEDASVPKTGVAITMYAASVAAKKDGVNVLFAGAGADELFAGYNRYKHSGSINQDCLKDILEMHEVNTYRDDTVASFTGITLRLPYLDEKFVEYSLSIPEKFKMSDGMNKVVLRRVGEELGIPDMITKRSKKAAQYGSRFDKALAKLSKKAGFSNKTDYINSFEGE
ncbi:asparagine synthetase B [Methanococcoides orientis]|uniref:asparagine synthase-related protein n=1 Tax=Methanococcoides orientis TaxID=2822137 RepID=UPI001E480741|nr:asparagine synthetase B [Methanococcoides orientis]UGV41231.1 asparagine synthetase B [Methanococcoides orientis]